MAAQPDVLLLCYQAAADAAVAAFERCADDATLELQTLETQSPKLAERDALAESWRYLQSHKTVWAQRYAQHLLVEFTKPAATRPTLGKAVQAAPSRFASFGLVDDADLTQKIDAQRLLQDLLPATENALTDLDALVGSALGLDFVAPERNPLRPEVFTRTLQQLMGASLEDAAATQLSIRHMAKPLGRELNLIYRQAIKALRQANIQAAHYQFRVQPAAPAPLKPPALAAHPDASIQSSLGGGLGGSDGDGVQGGNSRPQALADLSDQGVKAGLFSDFLSSGGGAAAEQGLAAPYYDDIEAELAAIKASSAAAACAQGDSARASAPMPMSCTAQARLERTPAVDRPLRAVNAHTSLSEQVWGPYGTAGARTLVRTQLKKEATKVSQVLGLDVVRELVSQVAQDPRLLGPVREAIVALEPSLLRLAMVDPRFFSDERHAGRQLMERVAQRSFKYNDEFSPEFNEFFLALTATFNQLNASTVEDTKPFRAALATLEQIWNAQDQQEFDKRQQVLQALRFAQERQNKADQIAFDLSARSDLEKVPGVVLDFLFGPWALAMANARLLDVRNQVDPEGFGSVVPDLVWSVKSDVTLKQPAKLIDMIPGLLEKLHSGLAMLGQDPKENEAFFESLLMLHRPVLKLRRLKSQRDAEESNAAPLEPEDEAVTPAERLEKLRALSDAPLWMGRNDLDAAGFEDTQPTQAAELAESITADSQTGEPSAAGDPENITLVHLPDDPLAMPSSHDIAHRSEQVKEQAALTLSRLKTGSWVDLYSKRQWLRAQLIWASSHATLFMFISHGGQPHSMTKRSCEKLIAQRLFRPVDTQGVVAQALGAVVDAAAAQSRAAQRNSVADQNEPEMA